LFKVGISTTDGKRRRNLVVATSGTGTPTEFEAKSAARPVLRLVFKYVNAYFMVPAFRLGLGWAVGSPPGGYIMVLKTLGNKSGKTRYAPVNYAILDGSVYCLAGWGRKSHWFANLAANPHVDLLMPGGALSGVAEEVLSPDEARRATLGVVRNAGFATLFGGLNPLTATDEQILEKVGHAPVVRIRPVGPGNGPFDPGGLGWVSPLLGQVACLIWLAARLRRRFRG
jgi:deazaflavin-dependent oxidoreductase (nitroreductase family)